MEPLNLASIKSSLSCFEVPAPEVHSLRDMESGGQNQDGTFERAAKVVGVLPQRHGTLIFVKP